MKVPIFGKLSHNIAVARFTRTLSTLLTSGVPILQAMETVAGAIDNETFTDVIMKARARIREGDPIGEPLEKSGLFPPMVVQMISIGEETGALDPMLSKVADFYESEVETQLQSLAAALGTFDDRDAGSGRRLYRYRDVHAADRYRFAAFGRRRVNYKY